MRFRELASLVCLLMIAACGGSDRSPTAPASPPPAPAPAPAPEPTPLRWTLTGTITEFDDTDPVAGARVAITEGANEGRSADADAEGRYRFETLEPGTFGVQVTANGFDPVVRSVTLSSDLTVDVELRRAGSQSPEPPPPAAVLLRGTTIDGISDAALGGVAIRIDGVGEAVSGADGSFQIEATEPEQVRSVSLSAPGVVERRSHLRVPGPPATLSLIPASLDLGAFDQMFRNSGFLERWVSPPRIVVQRRVLQFSDLSQTAYVATATLMPDEEVDGLIADLRWALPQLTGGAFDDFAGERRETAEEGERVDMIQPGEIVVARFAGLQDATSFWGYGRWMTSAGEVRAGIVMLDSGFENSGSPFRRSLRAHEFGHALGYNHVTGRPSVMNSSARIEPNDFDRAGSKLAFRRPPMNRSPDIDPDPYTPNLGMLVGAIWRGDR